MLGNPKVLLGDVAAPRSFRRNRGREYASLPRGKVTSEQPRNLERRSIRVSSPRTAAIDSPGAKVSCKGALFCCPINASSCLSCLAKATRLRNLANVPRFFVMPVNRNLSGLTTYSKAEAGATQGCRQAINERAGPRCISIPSTSTKHTTCPFGARSYEQRAAAAG
jgi:hypothetical protein